MIAVDTSVVVAAFASWHEAHAEAREAVRTGPSVPAHVLVETYSVLTRLPPPHRAPPDLVSAFLTERFSEPPLALPPLEHVRLVKRAATLGVSGGGVYDALIAATVKHHGGQLLTRDRRATSTYDRLGVHWELLA